MKRVALHLAGVCLGWILFSALFFFSLNYALVYDHRPQPTGIRKTLLKPAQFIAYRMVLSPAVALMGNGAVIGKNGKMNRHSPVSPYVLIPFLCLAYGLIMYVMVFAVLSRLRRGHGGDNLTPNTPPPPLPRAPQAGLSAGEG